MVGHAMIGWFVVAFPRLQLLRLTSPKNQKVVCCLPPAFVSALFFCILATGAD